MSTKLDLDLHPETALLKSELSWVNDWADDWASGCACFFLFTSVILGAVLLCHI